MVVRLATWNDLTAVNDVLTRAFWDEDACGRVLHPLRNTYPADVVKFWRSKTRLQYWAWSDTLLVAIDQEGKVVAFAGWTMRGRVAEEAKPPWWDPRHSMHSVLSWYNAAEAWLSPNRAADPAMTGPPDVFEQAMAFVGSYWDGKRADGYYLDVLAVDPEAQKRGYGRQLVEWGLSKAREKRVCASVGSSFGSDPFYLKCGFERVVGNMCDGEGNPLREREVKGGNILFMDAPAEH